MRKHKYRGWNTNKKIMYSPEQLGEDELTLNPDGRGFVNVNGNSTKLSQYFSHILPLEFTGRQDKNGKEMYEGDIVNYAEKESYCQKCDTKIELSGSFCPDCGKKIKRKDFITTAKITFHKGAFTFEYDRDDDLFTWNTYVAESYIEWYEIIGNIYENPELLK